MTALLLFLCIWTAILGGVQAQPADSEGASFSTIPEYVQWITKACGDPATSNSAGCAALKDKLCGTRDTSEVLCLKNTSGAAEAHFRSASRYTRVTYLRCSLKELKCTTDTETYTGPARSVDPKSLAVWVQYASKCSPLVLESAEKPTPAAECAKLLAPLCSRLDVRCSKDAAAILDSNKQVLFRGEYARQLAFLQ